MSERSAIGKIWDDFSEYTTITAIGFISKESSLKGKLFWFCVFLILTAYTVYETAICFQTYYEYPVRVITQVTIQLLLFISLLSSYISINNFQLSSLTTFPAVTFCNLNPIMTSKLRKIGNKIVIKNFFCVS